MTFFLIMVGYINLSIHTDRITSYIKDIHNIGMCHRTILLTTLKIFAIRFYDTEQYCSLC